MIEYCFDDREMKRWKDAGSNESADRDRPDSAHSNFFVAIAVIAIPRPNRAGPAAVDRLRLHGRVAAASPGSSGGGSERRAGGPGARKPAMNRSPR